MTPRVRPQRSVVSGDHGLPAALNVVTNSDKHHNLGPAPSAVKRLHHSVPVSGTQLPCSGASPPPAVDVHPVHRPRRLKAGADTPCDPTGVHPPGCRPTRPYQFGPHEPDVLDSYTDERSRIPLPVIEWRRIPSHDSDHGPARLSASRRSDRSHRACPQSLALAAVSNAKLCASRPARCPREQRRAMFRAIRERGSASTLLPLASHLERLPATYSPAISTALRTRPDPTAGGGRPSGRSAERSI
jgi:hypothetical protein